MSLQVSVMARRRMRKSKEKASQYAQIVLSAQLNFIMMHRGQRY